VSQFGIPPLQLTQNNGKHAAVSWSQPYW
jgi:hypothetical protein